MTKNKPKKEIKPFDKSDWTKLEDVEKFENDISGDWKQKGPYIVNTSQKLDYGVYIGNDKILTGVDENGKPIIKSR